MTMPQQMRVHNPGPYEVVIDRAGHQLAGSTSGTVAPDERTQQLLDAGLLIRLREPAKKQPATQKSKAAASDEARAENGAE